MLSAMWRTASNGMRLSCSARRANTARTARLTATIQPPTRAARAALPTTMVAARGGRPSSSSSSSTSTRPIFSSVWSTSWESRTSCQSWIAPMSPSAEELERHRAQEQGERQQRDDRESDVGGPAVDVFHQHIAVVHQHEQRDDRERQARGGGHHRYVGECQRLHADGDRHGGEKDEHRVGGAEPRVLSRLEVLAPVPAEALRKQIGDREHDLERRAEAGDAQRGEKEHESRSAERRGERQRDLLVPIHLDLPW